MFTPTKEELEELGFKKGLVYFHLWIPGCVIYFTSQKNIGFSLWLFEIVEHSHKIYPESLDDLKTIIRILTPKE